MLQASLGVFGCPRGPGASVCPAPGTLIQLWATLAPTAARPVNFVLGASWFNNATFTLPRVGVYAVAATGAFPAAPLVPAGLPATVRLDVTAPGGFTGQETLQVSNATTKAGAGWVRRQVKEIDGGQLITFMFALNFGFFLTGLVIM